MRHTYLTKNAFTMLELILVIVILGIVSSIGASIIANVYESYIVQRAQYRSSIKTGQALTQIANRLRYAIAGTVGARANKTDTFTPLTEISSTGTRNVLQWVGYDGDSFEAIASAGNRKPGWSGFIDIRNVNTSTTTLVSPGSNLNMGYTIKSNLGGTSLPYRLFFPNNQGSYDVSTSSGENITISGLSSGDTISERYKLAWSSYALVFEEGNLWLYYNFVPTTGATIGSKRSLLMANITTFSFQGSEGSLRIKICQYENMNKDTLADAARSCKEKIILY